MKLRYFTLCAIAMGIAPMAMAQTVSEGDTIAKRIFMGDTVDAVAASLILEGYLSFRGR